MIDIHAHILPGIDDGAQNLDDTLQMARIAADSGTTDLVATPHCNIPGRYHNYFDEVYQEAFLMAKDAIEQAEIPLRLYPGMEVYTTENTPELFEQGKIMTLNGSHYLLMEFGFDANPDFADQMLERMKQLGVIPVIAHIERYLFVQDFPEIVNAWHRKGYVIQCNRGSFQGRFGRKAQALAYYLMDSRLTDVIASDAHRPYIRTPDMQQTWLELSMTYPEGYLKRVFQTNPRQILKDSPIDTRR